MAKDVVVRVRCDRCGGENAHTYTEENSKGKPVEIDLDDPCHAEHEKLKQQYAEAVEKAKLILAPIFELADDKGVKPGTPFMPGKTKPKPPSAQRGERICLLCPETRDSDHLIRVHFQDAHGLSGSFVEAYGTDCPLDGQPFESLGHHSRQAHADLEMPHYSHAFRIAQKDGDPHGVVAKQIAALEELVAKAA